MLGSGNWRKTVINVVLIALVINFSLFFAKVVIDAGNVLAVGVYSSMGAPSVNEIETKTDVGQRGIATGIAAQFQPQAFIGAAGARALTEPMDALIIFIVAAVVSIAVAWVFFQAMMVFTGRIVAFWFLMIISPFALISMTLPKGNIFNWWWSTLLNQSFMAPVFLFMVYFVMQGVSAGGGILNGVIGTSSSAANFIFDKLVLPIIMSVLIYLALKEALDMAKSMSGKFGAVASEYTSKALGLGVAVATGGAALAAGKIGAASIAKGTLQEGATSSSALRRGWSKTMLLASDKMQNATFDPRNLGGGIGKGLGLGAGNKMTYTSQTKDWRADQEAKDKRMAALLETPASVEERARAKINEAAQAKAAAEKEARKSPEGETFVAATKKLAEATEKLAEAKKTEQDILAQIKAAEKAGDTNREQLLRTQLSTASAGVTTALKEHGAQKGVALQAEKDYSDKHAKNLAQKDDAIAVAKKEYAELIKKEGDRRESYAQIKENVHKDMFGRPVLGSARNRERAEKIRKETRKVEKTEEEKDAEKEIDKMFQKAARNYEKSLTKAQATIATATANVAAQTASATRTASPAFTAKIMNP